MKLLSDLLKPIVDSRLDMLFGVYVPTSKPQVFPSLKKIPY